MSLSVECDRTSQIIPLNIHTQVREYNLCIFKYLTTGSIKKIQTKTSEFVVLSSTADSCGLKLRVGGNNVTLLSPVLSNKEAGGVNRKLSGGWGGGGLAQDPIMFAQYYNRSGPGPK